MCHRSSGCFFDQGILMSRRMMLYACVLLVGLIVVLRTDFRTTPKEVQVQREREPQLAQQNTTQGSTPAPSPLPPPQKAEVRGALQRIYGQAVLLEERTPAFISGDFNGDQAQDLIVSVRPADRHLANLNDPLANWIIQDVREKPDVAAARKRPPAIKRSDILLAVIHGYGAQGWRDTEARQAYLVRNASGSTMRPYPWQELLPKLHQRKFAGMTGDAVIETLDGQEGFLYWNGARYVWHAQSHQILAQRQ